MAKKKYWQPSWLGGATRLPLGIGKHQVLRDQKEVPKGTPPQGGAWVKGEAPKWLK